MGEYGGVGCVHVPVARVTAWIAVVRKGGHVLPWMSATKSVSWQRACAGVGVGMVAAAACSEATLIMILI